MSGALSSDAQAIRVALSPVLAAAIRVVEGRRPLSIQIGGAELVASRDLDVLERALRDGATALAALAAQVEAQL